MYDRWDGQDELKISAFDVNRFPFRRWFTSALGLEELELLHQVWGVTPKTYRQYAQHFQSKFEPSLEQLAPTIDDFFTETIVPIFGPIASRQVTPTLRSHFAVTDAELMREASELQEAGYASFLKRNYFQNYRPGIFHRDKDYGLVHGAVNVWIPVTPVSGANSLWIGGPDEDGRDAMPITLTYGQCLFFDGANRWHGAVWNTSPCTRISFDLRFLPERHLCVVSRFA